MISKYQPLILFFLGFFIFMFTRASAFLPTIEIAIIIAPIFILRFIRTLPAKRGIWLTLLGFLLSLNIALFGLYSISDGMEVLLNSVRNSLLALLYFLPFMADRLIYPKLNSRPILSTLLFPVAATAIFFLSSLEGPFDGVVSKTIYAIGPLSFQQLNSITGLWGFIFIYSWVASIINYAWEESFKIEKILRPAVLFFLVYAAIFYFGIIRINSQKTAEKVKVAAVVLVPEDGVVVSMTDVLTDKWLSPFEPTLSRVEKLSKTASDNGAKIVAFQEFAFTINQNQQERLKEEIQRIADENDIYLNITYAYFGDDEKGENISILADNNGEIVVDYTKRYLLGIGAIGETSVFKKGEEKIQSVQTPYGRVAVSICRDMNFPAYIKQAADQNVDIMINPSYDNPKSLTPVYYERSIEFGFSTVRPTYNGVSYIEDYNGRIIGYMDSDATDPGILYADIPTKGVKTIYGKIGDTCGWACVALLIIIVVPITRNKEIIALYKGKN